MNELLFKFLKWTDECGSQELVRKKFIQNKISYEVYQQLRQSAAEQELITGSIGTGSGYFVPDDTTLSIKGAWYCYTKLCHEV